MNIANQLARNKSLNIGILDADVYGPSLPYLCDVTDCTIKKSTRIHSNTSVSLIEPLVTVNGIKCMSFGYVNPKSVVGAVSILDIIYES